MDWGDIGTLTPGTYAQDKTGATITPGWKVLDARAASSCRAMARPARRRRRRQLRPVRLVRRLVGRHQRASPKENQDAAYDFLSYMSARPSPARMSHWARPATTRTGPRTSRTSSRGSTPASARPPPRTTSAPSSPASRTRTWSSTCDPVDQALPAGRARYSGVPVPRRRARCSGRGQAIADGWNAISDEAGREAQLAAYVASLGVQR